MVDVIGAQKTKETYGSYIPHGFWNHLCLGPWNQDVGVLDSFITLGYQQLPLLHASIVLLLIYWILMITWSLGPQIQAFRCERSERQAQPCRPLFSSPAPTRRSSALALAAVSILRIAPSCTLTIVSSFW